MTDGWAVVDNGEINVRSVSPTRIGAIVNWLLTDKRLLVLRTTTDEQIERMWQANKGAAEVEVVDIARRSVNQERGTELWAT